MDQPFTDIRVSVGPAATEAIPWKEILGFAPHLLWAAVLVSLLLWTGRQNLAQLLSRIRKISVAGVEIELEDEIKAAGAIRGKPVDGPSASRLARRIARCGHVADGAKILWIDDVPQSHDPETELVEHMGASVILATSTAAGAAELARMRFDLVISDIGRTGAAKGGLESLGLADGAPGRPPVIFYVGDLTSEGTPAGAFGITNRPDELLHLVLDALARRRG